MDIRHIFLDGTLIIFHKTSTSWLPPGMLGLRCFQYGTPIMVKWQCDLHVPHCLFCQIFSQWCMLATSTVMCMLAWVYHVYYGILCLRVYLKCILPAFVSKCLSVNTFTMFTTKHAKPWAYFMAHFVTICPWACLRMSYCMGGPCDTDIYFNPHEHQLTRLCNISIHDLIRFQTIILPLPLLAQGLASSKRALWPPPVKREWSVRGLSEGMKEGLMTKSLALTNIRMQHWGRPSATTTINMIKWPRRIFTRIFLCTLLALPGIISCI